MNRNFIGLIVLLIISFGLSAWLNIQPIAAQNSVSPLPTAWTGQAREVERVKSKPVVIKRVGRANWPERLRGIRGR
jgi:hypothetical protein